MTTTTTTTAARRTRPASRWTELFLFVTALFGVWAVSLIVLTVLAIAQPAFFYSDQKSFIKAAGSTVVAFLALSQAYSMNAVMGHLPRGGIKIKYLMRAHRYGGRTAIVLAAVVAYFCMTDLGAPSNPLRGLIHAIFGSTAFAALGIKFALIRWRPEFAYRAAPWLGGYAASAFVIVWITSGLAYYTGNL
jgi:hypothetical protein